MKKYTRFTLALSICLVLITSAAVFFRLRVARAESVRQVDESELAGLLKQTLLFSSASTASLVESIACGETKRDRPLSTLGQRDAYSFNGLANEAVVLTAVATSGNVCVYAELYSSAGAYLGRNACNSSSFSLRLPADDMYTILVYDSGLNDTGTYDLNLSFTTGRCAAALACSPTQSGELTSKAQLDAYRFSGSAGEAVVLSAANTSGNMCVYAELYSPAGAYLGRNGCNSNSFSLALPMTGTYTVLVYDSGHNDIGSYDFDLDFTTGRCAATIADGSTQKGNLTSKAQHDTFTFCGVAGSSVIVSALATSGSVCVYAELYDPSGTYRGRNACNSSSFSLPLPANGIYTLLVYDSGHNDVGSYNVSLSYIGTPCPPAPDFTLTCNPAPMSVSQGGSAPGSCTVTSLNGFSSTVSLSVSGLVRGMGFTFLQSQVTPPPYGTSGSQIVVYPDLRVPLNTYRLQITGTSGAPTARSHDFILPVTVTPATAILPTVTTTVATAITSTGATLNGSVNPNGSATNISFEWGTDSTLSTFNTTPPQAVGAGTTSVPVSAHLSGLTAGTTYYYRLAGVNSAGTAKGETLSFTTSGSPTLDCEVIQQALDQGGVVTLQAEVYTCRAPLVINRNNTWLRGQGPTTLLRLADNANAPVIVIGQAIAAPTETRRNVRVSDLMIDGNRLHQTSETFPVEPALRNNGVSVRRAEDVLIERVTVRSARSGGLVTELGCRRITVRDFTSYDNQFDGLAGYETEESLFSGLHLYDNLAAGLSFDIRFNKNIVGDVVITGSRKVGIFMRDAQDNLFQSMQIRGSDEHGIFLAQVDADATKPAAGNTFVGLVVSDSAGAGLRVNDASCINNLVCAAQFINNRGGGISEVIPNLVRGCETISR